MKIQAVRGMQDLLPAQKKISRAIEDVVREVLASYGYREIGLPQLEQTELFKRVVGENTDIVEKETGGYSRMCPFCRAKWSFV